MGSFHTELEKIAGWREALSTGVRKGKEFLGAAGERIGVQNTPGMRTLGATGLGGIVGGVTGGPVGASIGMLTGGAVKATGEAIKAHTPKIQKAITTARLPAQSKSVYNLHGPSIMRGLDDAFSRAKANPLSTNWSNFNNVFTQYRQQMIAPLSNRLGGLPQHTQQAQQMIDTAYSSRAFMDKVNKGMEIASWAI